MEFDITGNLRPQLAKALPEISKDSLIYTFDLRDDVQFQNGTPLTSEDVKYSIEYTIDPANKASRGPIFSRLSHVETDGPLSAARASEGTVLALDQIPHQAHGRLAQRLPRQTGR